MSQLTLFEPALQITGEVEGLLANNCLVAFGVSGGKDSSAMVLAANDYVSSKGVDSVLVHSDLGQIEWPETGEWVQRLADKTGIPLVTVSRKKGGIIERWESRWRSNLSRYQNLETIKLVSPWSSAKLRFCTSELKVDQITRYLNKNSRDTGREILNAVGLRGDESARRSALPIVARSAKLRNGLIWHPIHNWTKEDVFEIHKKHNFPLHPAYTGHGSSRLSCSFCVLASRGDHFAALRHPGNLAAFKRLVELEIDSGFSFQTSGWLFEKETRFFRDADLKQTKARMEKRIELESKIPERLLYKYGSKPETPCVTDAEVLSEVRKGVLDLYGLPHSNTTVEEIRGKFGGWDTHAT